MILFSYAFRPFFLAASVFAVIAIGLWTASLVNADLGRYLELDLFWHTHEMIFGFVAAAMAGFLLTAISNWTGRAPVSGAHLVLLVSLWLTARIALMSAATVPPVLLSRVLVVAHGNCDRGAGGCTQSHQLRIHSPAHAVCAV